MLRHSLLSDPLIHVRFRDETVRACTLPEVIVALLADTVLGFEVLQPHQQQAWHSFLVQLVAMAVARIMPGTFPEEANRWRRALLELAGGEEAAWYLVVSDLRRPAFLQPPVPEGSLEAASYRDDVQTPDQLDVLITSKNHDVKARRIVHPRPEHWLFALVTLQTMEGYHGQGNYGIVRMNGGYGNRPLVGLTRALTPGAHFRRDVEVLLEARPSFADRYNLDGHALLWLLPWDGKKHSGIPLESCDPYFIEVCRRIRFLEKAGRIVCWRANTRGPRIAAPKELKGITGDPWTPVERKKPRALTVSDSGFTYRLLQQVFLSGDYEPPVALSFRADERAGVYLVARTLVRGEGKTGGLHCRIVPVSRPAARWLSGSREQRATLARRAEQRVRLAAEVQRKVLYPALAALLSGGRDARVEQAQVAPWIEAFDRAVDSCFFDNLWASVEQDEETARRDWENFLLKEAQRQFAAAERSTPIASAHRWRARSRAHAIFEGNAREVLPYAFSV
ncbi:type I-E CRISPR-associated protein Cse1/CasA [Rhodothermus profundi]|uniref:CRISPR-associated protein, Cse1 family n=1 Tax=Rhodothermus profundi TaxID=633813 RepID=A0A1M6UE83_9BACT|nr:type I-E CRISPR-associated protein Cse1/CasA [Rhodothermus profundi]SHK67545.1 CRISPR-associated protein, Cse1 family [Rhodothermus profundi]